MAASTFSPFTIKELTTATWPLEAAVWMPLAPLLLGINNGTPFLNSICRMKLVNHSQIVKAESAFHTIAVSGWPFKAAMCINVLPSFVRSNTEALNLSGK